MKEFIIGKEGDQKFKISEKRNKVSRKHCKITIDDNGQWYVDDLDSTNGTYIIDENGEMVQVSHYPITEFTRIILADQTPFGYSFIAHHVLEEDPLNYRKEFIHLLNILLFTNYHKPRLLKVNGIIRENRCKTRKRGFICVPARL